MMTRKVKPIIIETCAVLLGMLLMYTAVSKVLEYQKFIFQMRLSPLVLMQHAAPVLAWLVPLVEFVIVGCLLLPSGYRIGFKAAFVLLGVFELYIGGMMLSGLELGCTCGGVVSKLSWRGHLIFNAAFMGVAWLGGEVCIINGPCGRFVIPSFEGSRSFAVALDDKIRRIKQINHC